MKKRLAMLTVFAVAFSTLLVAPQASAAPAERDLLLHYDFSAVTGTTVPDSSTNSNDGVIKGAGAVVTGSELALPGGASNSDGAYVQLPTGLFDGRDTLTISTWLRNEKGAGNYAAMFFGSASNPPAQYWLLNPKNPAGLFKSVITNGSDAGAPWGTEAGISPTNASSGIAGPATSGAWGLYTTVIEPTRITGYFDGKKIATVPTTRTVTQFGSNLVSFIGKSSYADDLYKGGVRDVKVWTAALDDASIAAEYSGGVDEATVQEALAADADALAPGSGAVTTDRTFPTTGGNGSIVSWASDRPDAISDDGTVTRPTAGGDVPVTLTATLSLAGRSLTRTFSFIVLADTPQNNLRVAVDGFDLGITRASSFIVLAASVGDVAVTWATSDAAAIAIDGRVTRAAAEKAVTLTATFSLDGQSATREFAVTVLAEDAGRIGSYIVGGDTTRTDVLHLAASTSAAAVGDFEPLNNGRGVLYPSLGSAKFGPPVLVRAPDGAFRLLSIENGSGSRLYVYDSAELTAFTNERLVSFVPAGVTATDVSAVYDNGLRGYRVAYTGQGGARFEVTTSDFASFSAPTSTAVTAAAADGTFPSGAVGASSIGVTQAEYALVTSTFSRVVNTGVRAFDDVTIDEGETPVLPETATVEYSSGDTSSMPVEWDAGDLAAVTSAGPGTYTVDGTVTRPTFPDPLVERRADPDVTLGDDGKYYFTGSYPMTYENDPNGYDRIVLRSADTIQGLKTAPEATIWHEKNDPVLNRYIWAPELEKIGDDWYILFTAGRSSGFDIRPAMLKFTGGAFGGDAALDPANWTSLGQVKGAAGDPDAFTHFSLDMTHFSSAGRHYVAWAEAGVGGSTLRMAEIDPADPIQLISQSILLSTPTLAWEQNGLAVDEGPAVIQRDGTIMIAFSAATVDDKYCVGVLTAAAGTDLLDPASWTKNPYPLLTTDDVPGQVGPGHNSFTVDEYGNPVIVYHSRTVNDSSNPGEATDAGLFDPRRHARAALVHFTSAGLPVFSMTADEELAPSNAAVQVRVVVGDSGVIVEPQPGDAAISVSSSRVVAGDTVTVTGSGFASGESVALTLFSDPVSLGRATADATGAFTATVRIPLTTPAGAHTVRATGGSASADAALTVRARADGGASGSDASGSDASGSDAAPGSGAGGPLAMTGSGALFTGLGALALLISGALVLARRRRRV